jgi:glutamyl-tRNA synthetase
VHQRQGWEPDAVLNWLALTGWGVQHDTSTSSPQRSTPAPDSTAVMSLAELIHQVCRLCLGVIGRSFILCQFDLASVTHRRTFLDPMKLHYLNKHHLMRMWSQSQGLEFLARRVHESIKEAFPSRQETDTIN